MSNFFSDILLAGFLICRFVLFGVVHGMKDWPVVLESVIKWKNS